MSWYAATKRATDILISTILLAVTTPLWMSAGIAVAVTSGWPVLYRAKRLGRNGTVFDMYKFRSMRQGADKAGPGITGNSDSRVTPVGRFLRQWKLDELPQLINVLRGEMSLVGPRPEDPRYLSCYSAAQLRVLSVRPGVTGPTQIRFRHEERMLTGPDIDSQYREYLLPKKLNSDLSYVNSRSTVTDVRLLLSTIKSLFVSDNSEGIEEEGPPLSGAVVEQGFEEHQ